MIVILVLSQKNFRKKIELEAGEAFTTRMESLCELEADIDNVKKRMASPVIQKFENELKLIGKKSSKDTKMLKAKVRFISSHFRLLVFRSVFRKNPTAIKEENQLNIMGISQQNSLELFVRQICHKAQ